MSICHKITTDILKDCDNMPTKGLAQKIVLINKEDVLSVTHDTNNKSLLTALTLKTGTSGIMMEGMKSAISSNITPVVSETGFTGVTVNISGLRVFNPTEVGASQINSLMNGEFIAVVEKKWSGEDKQGAFEVLGLTHGLQMTADGGRDLANDGAFIFTLATPDGYTEPSFVPVLRMTDYDTTKTAFENKFSA